MPNNTGRPRIRFPEEFPELYRQWKAGKLQSMKFWNQIGWSKSTFYRNVPIYEAYIDAQANKLQQSTQSNQIVEQNQQQNKKYGTLMQKIKALKTN